ncbi:MAG TPA: hypothetical protein VGM26_06235 [Rhizomicrobium sp.]|jgi:hypothetical protein
MVDAKWHPDPEITVWLVASVNHINELVRAKTTATLEEEKAPLVTANWLMSL